jgi:hypothetical protein
MQDSFLRYVVKGVATAFGALALLALVFNVVTIPGAYSGLDNSFVKVVGMFSPLAVLLLTTSGVVMLWWKLAYARWLFFVAMLVQVFVVASMCIFIWHGLPFSVFEFLTGKGIFLSLPIVILVGTIVLLSRLDRDSAS